MAHVRKNPVASTCRAWVPAVVLSLLCLAAEATDRAKGVNLALHKPASSSSIENDEHAAAKANDGNTETSWCADDEPEGGAEWWQVDLERPLDLSGCQITWPYDGKNYRYKVEGSVDRKNWSMLSDQTSAVSRSQVQDLKFEKATQIRYVKITVTGFDQGCWAAIAEVKVFGVR